MSLAGCRCEGWVDGVRPPRPSTRASRGTRPPAPTASGSKTSPAGQSTFSRGPLVRRRGWLILACVVSGFRVQGSGFRVQGSGFRVQGSGFRVQGSGFGFWGHGVPERQSGLQRHGLKVRGWGVEVGSSVTGALVDQFPSQPTLWLTNRSPS